MAQNSRRLYLSKISDAVTCPMKYYWIHHRWIHPPEDKEYMIVGSTTHHGIELYGRGRIQGQDDSGLLLSKRAIEAEQRLDEKVRAQVWDMVNVYKDTFSPMAKDLVTVEEPITFEISKVSPYFDTWWTKADNLFLDWEDNIWIGEVKTTSGWGEATQAYYHKSLQTISYFFIIEKYLRDLPIVKEKALDKPLKGTKLFVITRTKIPRCIPENIILTDHDRRKAQQFIANMVHYLNQIEKGAPLFHMYMTNCIGVNTGECEYYNLCYYQGKKEYLEDIIKEWFVVRDPDEHLMEVI